MEPKTNCKKCGCLILQRTADRNNGYCEPHGFFGLPYLERLESKVNNSKPITEFDIDYSKIPDDKLEELTALISEMDFTTDVLYEFDSVPKSNWTKTYVELGYAIVRDKEWIEGVEIETKINKEFFEHTVEQLSFAQYLGYYPLAQMEDYIVKYKPEDQFMYFKSCPDSWRRLFGVEEILHIRDEKIIYRRGLLVS